MDRETIKLAIKDFCHKNEYELEEYPIYDQKKHPFAIICPGGGYSTVCSHIEGVPMAKKLNGKGYAAFILRYRCKKKALYPGPQDDLARAINSILARADELNLDSSHYSIWGASAGGHLAASFGTEKMGYLKYDLPSPDVLILLYPVVTMGEKTHKYTRNNLLEKKPTTAMIDLASIEKQVTSVYPPTCFWCGSNDITVSPENSHMLKKALEENGIPYEFTEYPDVKHGVGLGIGLSCESWFDKATKFIEQYSNDI